MLEILLEQYMSKIYQCIYLYIYGKTSRYRQQNKDRQEECCGDEGRERIRGRERQMGGEDRESYGHIGSERETQSHGEMKILANRQGEDRKELLLSSC